MAMAAASGDGQQWRRWAGEAEVVKTTTVEVVPVEGATAEGAATAQESDHYRRM